MNIDFSTTNLSPEKIRDEILELQYIQQSETSKFQLYSEKNDIISAIVMKTVHVCRRDSTNNLEEGDDITRGLRRAFPPWFSASGCRERVNFKYIVAR